MYTCLYCQRPSVISYSVTHNVTDGNTGENSGSGAILAAMNDTFTLPANQTWYTFDDAVYGNIYFVEVTPSNSLGFGHSDVVFISKHCMRLHVQVRGTYPTLSTR